MGKEVEMIVVELIKPWVNNFGRLIEPDPKGIDSVLRVTREQGNEMVEGGFAKDLHLKGSCAYGERIKRQKAYWAKQKEELV